METLATALITAGATVAAAAITALARRQRPTAPTKGVPRTEQRPVQGAARVVYYEGTEYRFLNFGGKNSRIAPVDGGESFLAPTHELFHDRAAQRRITRDSIVAHP